MLKFQPRKVAVLGAGTMGLQIAVDLGDKGYQVDLFDLPGKAQQALARAVKNQLCSFTGRLQVRPHDFVPANYSLLNQADWIVEAVFEQESVKDEVNAIIAQQLKPGAIVSTNTSGIGINAMAAKQPANFRQAYCLSHFFNPIKYLGLLEVCPVADTDPQVHAAFSEFATMVLGKTVVQVKDTPNFVGNRIGGLCLLLPFHLDTEGLNILDMDRICACIVGWEPHKTWDIIGLQLAAPVGENVYHRVSDDPLREYWNPNIPRIQTLLDKGLVGRKGKTKSGFLARAGRQKLMYDFSQDDYVPAELSDHPSLQQAMDKSVKGPEKLKILLAGDDPAARFARSFFYTTAGYALNMVGQICDHIADIDTALEHGFNWPRGIFKLVQEVGLAQVQEGIVALGQEKLLPEWFTQLVKDQGRLYAEDQRSFFCLTSRQLKTSPEPPGVIHPEKIAQQPNKVIYRNDDALVLDISDEHGPVSLLVFTSKSNAIGLQTIQAGHQALDWAEKHQGALVIGNTAPNFGAGANLELMYTHAVNQDHDSLRTMITSGQEFMQRLCYSPVPTVAAPCGFTLGGSSEMALACDRRVSNARVIWGQTELNVGVIPAWTGLMRMLKNMQQGLLPYYLWGKTMTVEVLVDHIMPVWETYSWIKMSRDAYHAREMGFLQANDVIVPAQGLGQPYVLKRAREVAQSMLLAGYQPPTPFQFNCPGKLGLSKFELAADLGHLQDQYPVKFPAHNTLCAKLAAKVLCGGEDAQLGEPVTEKRLLELELEGFLEVVMRPEAHKYIARIIKK